MTLYERFPVSSLPANVLLGMVNVALPLRAPSPNDTVRSETAAGAPSSASGATMCMPHTSPCKSHILDTAYPLLKSIE